MPKKAEDQYSDDEAQKRFVAALHGARIAGHRPMESISKKVAKKRKPKKKAKASV